MQLTTTVTFEGNLATEPTLAHTTRQNRPVVELVVLVNRYHRDDAGRLVQDTPTRHHVKAFGQLAEHTAALELGTTVLVHGRVETDTWTDKETGRARYRDVIYADAIGASLRWAPLALQPALPTLEETPA